MSRFDTEPAGSSNASIIIKNDSSIDDTDVQPEFGASKRYDLEVQKPSERQKIINDHNFFKSLSYSFYAEPNSSPKSFSSLNHYFHLYTFNYIPSNHFAIDISAMKTMLASERYQFTPITVILLQIVF